MKSQNIAQTLSLEELASRYDAFLLDAYGVFWGSSEIGVYPGAAEAMKYLVDQGKYVGILSNSTQLASKEKEKLSKHGLQERTHFHFLLTSGEVARECFQEETLPFSTPRYTYWVFGGAHPRFSSHTQLFEGTKYQETPLCEEADFIYIAIPHINGVDQENPEVFRHAVQALPKQIPALCVNPDRFAMEGAPPRPVVRQGSIAALLREEQVSVYFIGKPSKTVFAAALRRLPPHIAKEKILMVGDTPETDIRGANHIGLDAALITKTGILANLLQEKGEGILHQLPSSDRPQFLLEYLRRTLT
jgi:HAD superfamily hydrolase (TIGR01459 family)